MSDSSSTQAPRSDRSRPAPKLLDVSGLAGRLAASPPPDAPDAELVGMLAAEPVVGRVLVALWACPLAAGGEEPGDDAGPAADAVEVRHELLDADGSPLSDANALQEALTLCVMAEALEELAPPEPLALVAERLDALLAGARDVPDELSEARTRLGELHALATAGDDQPRMLRIAEPLGLDGLAAAVRELELAWQGAEHVAAHLARGEHDVGIDGQALWQLLGMLRQGPLAVPPAVAIEQGRAAGELYAQEARETMVVREAAG